MYLRDATTPHNDMKGTIALDWHNVGGASIDSFAKSLGIDTEKYTPVAFHFTIVPPQKATIHVLLVEENDERNKFNSIVEYAEGSGGKLPVVEFEKEVDINEFLTAPHHIEIFLTDNTVHEHLVVEDFKVVGKY